MQRQDVSRVLFRGFRFKIWNSLSQSCERILQGIQFIWMTRRINTGKRLNINVKSPIRNDVGSELRMTMPFHALEWRDVALIFNIIVIALPFPIITNNFLATFPWYIKAKSYGCTIGGITPQLVNVSPSFSKMANVLFTTETLPKVSLNYCWQDHIERNTIFIFLWFIHENADHHFDQMRNELTLHVMSGS